MPESPSPHIELVGVPQPTLATVVRSVYPGLARALSHAFELLARSASLRPGTPMHKLLALQQLGTSEVELVASIAVVGAPSSSSPVECSEIPAGRYLTLACDLDPAAVARVLPTLRDWLGEHRESPVGSLLLQIVCSPGGGASLVTRLRVQGGLVSRRPSLLAHEGGLEAVAAALAGASHSR